MTKFADRVVMVFKWIGAAAIAAMMFLTCVDVVLRATGRPILGAVEIVGFLATIGLACSMPYAHQSGGHAGVDMLIRHFSPRVQGWVDTITGLVTTVLFLLVSWRCFVYAENLRRTGEVSMTLEFPAYIFVYFLGLAFAALCVIVLSQTIQSYRQAVSK